MGLLDGIKSFFYGNQKTQPVQQPSANEINNYVSKINMLADKIKKINSFDMSVRNI